MPTAAAIGAWLARNRPDWSEIAVGLPRPPSQGFSNETWLLDLAWREAGGTRRQSAVLRAAPREPSVFPDYDLRLQYRCLEALRDSAVPVPAVIGFEVSPAVIGTPFFVMEAIDGRAPNENPLYHLEGWLHEASAAEQAATWNAGIDVLAALAGFDWKASGLAELETAGDPGSPLGRQLDYFRKHMLWAERLGRPYPHLHRACDWLMANRPREERIALCWGDAKLGNCLFRDGRLVAALDWENAHLGDPVMDLAWWLIHDRALSEGYGVPRLAGLPNRTESVARWEERTGWTACHLDYYEVFAAFKFSSIMARIGTLFVQRGWVPATANMDVENGAARVLARLAEQHGF